MYTSRKVDVKGAQWVRNTAGFEHSDQHGFGLMDAYRLTRAAGVGDGLMLDCYHINTLVLLIIYSRC